MVDVQPVHMARPEAALAYAAAGWPVFPCKPHSKTPATNHGFKDATTEERIVRAWWAIWPTANVAIATGWPGPDVLDVDVKSGVDGYAALDRLTRAGLLAGAHRIVRTASGGAHYYLTGSSQGCGTIAAHGIDLKATGGYVIAPPSTVTYEDGSSGAYALVETADDPYIKLSWAAVKQLLAPPRNLTSTRRAAPSGSNVGALCEWLSRQTEGNRNSSLFWAACRAEEAGQVPVELGMVAVQLGLTHEEVGRTLASARRTVGAAR